METFPQWNGTMGQLATIKDVALHAGCGVATVSRVLNESGPTSIKMRQRVFAAVKDLNFEFSEVGRSLQSNMTRTIGCVVPTVANPVFADAVQGAQETFQNAGYQTLLVSTNYNPETELQAIRTLLAKQVDGFVLTVSDALTSEGLQTIKDRHLPCCLLFNAATEYQKSWFVDDHCAAVVVADEFSKMGHMITGFLALKFQSSDRSRQRYLGFVAGCKKNGMAIPRLLEIEQGTQDLTDLLNAFLCQNPDITGIFASNDLLALSTTRSLRSLGCSVPDEMSIVGFDGIEVGKMVEPSLATITTDPKMMGSGAAQTVLAVLNSAPPPAMPNPSLSFSFRAGDSLTTPAAERPDDEKVAALSPSNIPTTQTSKIQMENSK